ncbi:aminopeptidase N [Corynebacterium otitidis]|uniref:aminopeptidase N n=1 Tax=Corynebacterium otitidis TaxID=29321 RepID=UPI000627A3B0|nr:aminopeptidase N [Corynebacterium otitidis]KKO84071.1 aminopeptidase N [Corynebacterium otitidis]
MSSTNLTREEAAARAALIGKVHYDIDLDLTGATDREADTFRSRTSVDLEVNEAGSTFIDLRARGVRLVELDGVDVTADALATTEAGCYEEDEGIALRNLKAGDHRLVVDADAVYSRTGEGLHRFVDPVDGETYLYTQFETADAKRMFACFDQPDIKATYRLSVTAPAHWRVISNAEPDTATEGDSARHEVVVDYPLSTYLVALCAGPYQGVTDEWRGRLTHHPETPAGQPKELSVPLGVYCRASLIDSLDAERILTETKQGFDFYHRNFGFAYPFGVYNQVFVPEFNAGAMENAGCVTIRDEYVFSSTPTQYRYERRADTILHELAHMWFGDLVTMRWWDDLWLNESFATWASAISQAEETQYDTAWVTFANVEKSWAYEQDQLPTTHPISADAGDIETVEANFDGITYAKGASVLKQLQAYVGREEFFAGVRRHFAAHQFSNATFDDLLGSLEEASGRDLSGWAEQWLKTTGPSRLYPEFNLEDGRYSSFAVCQEADSPREHRVAVGLYRLEGDTVNRVRRVELDVSGGRTEVPELAGEEAADLVLVNDDDLTYCLMGLDEGSTAFALENIDRITEPMARTLCWSAAWEATREGRLKARDFVRLVARGASAETELAVLEKVLSQAVTALTRYAEPEWAAGEGRKLLARELLAGARGERPEPALVFARALARVPLTDAAADYFRGVLAGEAGSLTVDADLRWTALTALIAGGAVTDPEQEVARLEEQDRTASGARQALTARAAVPERAVKERVADEIFSGGLSNVELRAALSGLAAPGAENLLDGVAARYFDEAQRVWDEFSTEMATTTLEGLYPRWDVSSRTVERTGEFLEAERSHGLKRILVERRDALERALRLRSVDAE